MKRTPLPGCILLLLLGACGGAGQVRIAGHTIPAPPGYKLERPAGDFACFVPQRTLGNLGVSFCARPIIKKGVLSSNTFGIDAYPFLGHTVEVRGLASDGSKVADTIYFILETDDLFVFGECSGEGRGRDLLDRCLPQRASFNDWLRSILGA